MDLSFYKNNKIKVHYRTNPLNLFELADTKNMKRWMRRYFKETSKEKHKQLFEEAEAKMSGLDTEYRKIIQTALIRLSLDPDEFRTEVLQFVMKRKMSNEEKYRLRAIRKERNRLSFISLGHKLMLPKRY